MALVCFRSADLFHRQRPPKGKTGGSLSRMGSAPSELLNRPLC